MSIVPVCRRRIQAASNVSERHVFKKYVLEVRFEKCRWVEVKLFEVGVEVLWYWGGRTEERKSSFKYDDSR